MIYRHMILFAPLVSVCREIWTVLKRSEQLCIRQRLGESLARLLKEHEPTPPMDGTAVVFMTEVADADGGIEDSAVASAVVLVQEPPLL